jgi:elongation factor Ts
MRVCGPVEGWNEMDFTAADVKRLRETTGAGFADCRSALAEASSFDDAVKGLEQKGQAHAEKVQSKGRETKQGYVAAYVHHNGSLGVLLELNCSTDFVARNDEFRTLARELAMQVAGTNPRYISFEEIPPDVIEAERQALLADPDLQSKPEEIRERIVKGRLDKHFANQVLLEQAWIKDETVKVGDMVRDLIRKTGENIVVRRFARFQLGED